MGIKTYDWKFIGFCALTACAACAIGIAIYKDKMPKVDFSGMKFPSVAFEKIHGILGL